MHLSTSFLVSLGAAVTTISGALTSVTDFCDNPTGFELNVNVPANLTQKPAIISRCSGEAYATQTTYITLSEQRGIFTILTSSKRDSNCREVNTAKGLSRNAGGDNQGLISMVFVTGSSSSYMMTNVLISTYPDVFVAAWCYPGVAAGCVAGTPGASPISPDGECAKCTVKAMLSGYSGMYPKLATWHGTVDTLVKLPNLGEELKQCKLVKYKARDLGHTVPVQEAEDLTWFGL
ncbi:carbohydrate esterase family 1 protein [Didymella exigua CBS 183.55]|uniref:Carbohydrate esterase family 1 protein n=1 Tax=Didymella exigua CBS 183.55 TaxID=1150837 RepID=A0A6A5R978_9PLEO|nr:carbohydrate esterase family 1 protein [Didymella exigua CBS 183.55]KAF1923206.1 carbohydrate esterase family 1 protein [Didymella exigua CBS 183.55]